MKITLREKYVLTMEISLALLVGVNDYRSPLIKDLRGCVNDAERVERFLKTRFNVGEAASSEKLGTNPKKEKVDFPLKPI